MRDEPRASSTAGEETFDLFRLQPCIRHLNSY
ncbi:hypothetical protein PisoF_01506 [Pseudomonas sp. IsoF]|jgi:hypothetical protein|nr:hypothetical protein PisoF_01506 [Pseudomonas sp. IsoF]